MYIKLYETITHKRLRLYFSLFLLLIPFFLKMVNANAECTEVNQLLHEKWRYNLQLCFSVREIRSCSSRFGIMKLSVVTHMGTINF